MSTRCGYVAILGAPNAGKSTLLNALVGSKLAIVTPKAQTTRSRMRGICIAGDAQLVFIDTPGIFSTQKKFERAMVESAWGGLADADKVLFLIDAKRGIDENAKLVVERIAAAKKPVILVLNKIDLVAKESLLALAQSLHALLECEQTFMICAAQGDGVEDIKNYLAQHMPQGPWLFPEDELTDISERLLASEITREKIFLKLREELPYSISVETENWEEQKDGSVKINQVVMVQKDSQKQIVLGKGGEMLKAIGTAARIELDKLLGRKTHLFLFVKVVENWKENPESYRYLGLEYKS